MTDTCLLVPPHRPATQCPFLVASSGPAARSAWEEFIDGAISNDNTREAYRRAVCCFLEWCDGQRLEHASVTPGRVGRYDTGLTLAPAAFEAGHQADTSEAAARQIPAFDGIRSPQFLKARA